MPLKHLTETILIAILAVVTIVTGIVVATLPLLPQGLMPGLLILVATLLYGFGLYPMLKRDRADYEFRLLHFAPAILVAVWLLIQIIALKFPMALSLHRVWTWGWSLPGVLMTFLLLAAFILHVIRRRVPRLSILAGLFVPFLLLSTLSETNSHWRQSLAGALWRNVWSTIAWNPPVSLPPVDTTPSPALSSSASSTIASFHPVPPRKPPRLVGAGPEDALALAVIVLAAYCGVVHERARRRMLA